MKCRAALGLALAPIMGFYAYRPENHQFKMLGAVTGLRKQLD
jgi:hypothetical protein